MTDIIRGVLRKYMKKRGIKLEGKVTRRVLLIRSVLDSEGFERRVREVKEALSE